MISKNFYTLIFISLIAGAFSPSSSPFVIGLFFLSLLLLLYCWYYKNYRIPLLAGLLSCFAFSAVYTQLKIQQLTNISKQEFLASGYFSENNGKLFFTTESIKKQDIWQKENFTTLAYPKDKNISFDSLYLLKASYQPFTPDLLNSKTFIYNYYYQGIVGNLFIQETSAIKKDTPISSFHVKNKIKKEIASHFNTQTSGYLYGVLLDDKSDLEQYGAIQAIGLAHLFSASGYHVGLIYGIIFLLLKPFAKNKSGKLFRFFITLAIIWMYAFVLQFSPAIVRSCMLFSLLNILSLSNRQFSTTETLSLIGIGMILQHPLCVYSIGFQLSFLAVYSILYFFPMIKLLYPKNTPKLVLPALDLINVSTAAQILTLPLCIYYFSQIPIYSLLSNLIISPLVSIAIPASIFEFSIQEFDLQLLSPLIHLLFQAVDFLILFIANLPKATLNHVYLNEYQTLTLISVLLLFSRFLHHKKSFPIEKLAIGGLLLLVSIAITFYQQHTNQRQQKLYISIHKQELSLYHIKQKQMLSFGKSQDYVVNRLSKKHQIKYHEHFSTENKPQSIHIQNLEINLKKDSIFISKNGLIHLQIPNKKLPLTCFDLTQITH